MHGTMMKRLAAAAAVLMVAACTSPSGDTVSEQRNEAQRMRADTLTKLYKIHPRAQHMVKTAVGYAVFSNVGVKVILVSAGNGWGVVRDNATGRDTYMKMLSGGVGLGLGIKDFRGVFVFTTKQAMTNFVQFGWEASGDFDIAAKSGDKGIAVTGAIQVAPGIMLYQLTEHGLALQATINGTKYWPADELNAQLPTS